MKKEKGYSDSNPMDKEVRVTVLHSLKKEASDRMGKNLTRKSAGKAMDGGEPTSPNPDDAEENKEKLLNAKLKKLMMLQQHLEDTE